MMSREPQATTETLCRDYTLTMFKIADQVDVLPQSRIMHAVIGLQPSIISFAVLDVRV